MATRHTIRLHLLCAVADAAAVNLALGKSLPGQVVLGPVDGRPDLAGASGQWTEEEAVALLALLAALPVRVTKGPPLGLQEAAAKVIHAGDASDAFDPQERETWGRVLWGWDQGERPVAVEPLDTLQK